MKPYDKFLGAKVHHSPHSGFSDFADLSTHLYPFQRDLVSWALVRGKAAIFADCGMGKTLMQLVWADEVRKKTGGKVLILAPLAVAAQTVREAERFGINAGVSHGDAIGAPIVVTNYEKLHKMDPSNFSGIVLDESSILKNYSGKMRNQIIESFRDTPYRLACTATPAPNDHMELGNHSEFLGAMKREEMLAMFFVHDGGETQKWRIKGHAESNFWDWVCSWAAVVRSPSDLGYQDDGFSLPDLRIHNAVAKVDRAEHAKESGMLFAMNAITLSERLVARRESIAERAAIVAEIINGTDEPWIVWCNLNAEADAVTKLVKGSVDVRGSDKPDRKEESMRGFSDGDIRVLVSKPSICGFGMNWQHCSNVVFMGLSDSYEQFYQAVRRCWRYGQTSPVDCYIITAETENAVLENIKRKDREAKKMGEVMAIKTLASVRKNVLGENSSRGAYIEASESGDQWSMRLGDCVERTKEIDSESVGYSIFSPPFASLYTYSDSNRDMGNCRTHSEFYEHFAYLIPELLRVTSPGRLLSFHCMNLPTSKSRNGFIGISDFRGLLIKMFQDAGWIYHSEVVIWKDPVVAMQRTKALGLLYKQLRKDSAMSRQGIPDYLVTMRKPGDNPDPITHTHDDFPVHFWQRYASPVWMDVNPSRTLQYRSVREDKDERHICPLQLDVIERAIDLWSSPGDMVLSPFAGIGSEGVCAVEKGRRFTGIELKQSYFGQACANLKDADPGTKKQLHMFTAKGDQ